MTFGIDAAAISAVNGGYGATSWMTGNGRKLPRPLPLNAKRESHALPFQSARICQAGAVADGSAPGELLSAEGFVAI